MLFYFFHSISIPNSTGVDTHIIILLLLLYYTHQSRARDRLNSTFLHGVVYIIIILFSPRPAMISQSVVYYSLIIYNDVYTENVTVRQANYIYAARNLLRGFSVFSEETFRFLRRATAAVTEHPVMFASRKPSWRLAPEKSSSSPPSPLLPPLSYVRRMSKISSRILYCWYFQRNSLTIFRRCVEYKLFPGCGFLCFRHIPIEFNNNHFIRAYYDNRLTRTL